MEASLGAAHPAQRHGSGSFLGVVFGDDGQPEFYTTPRLDLRRATDGT
jgi:hypothetical protein